MRHRPGIVAIVTIFSVGLLVLALIPARTTPTALEAGEASASLTTAAANPDLLRTLDAEVAPAAQTSAETVRLAKADYSPAPAPTPAVASVPVAPDPVAAPLRSDSVGPVAVNLRAGPASSAHQIGVLDAGQAVDVIAMSNGWAQVTLANGTSGWVYSTYLASGASPAKPVAAHVTQARAVIQGSNDDLEDRDAHIASRLMAYAQPLETAPSIFTLHPGDEVHIAEVRGDWLRVETDDGISGWIRRAD